MKKILSFIFLTILLVLCCAPYSEASIISDRKYRIEQKRIYNNEVKEIRKLFKIHNEYANLHDIEKLKSLYSEKYYDGDGFNKEVYFKSVEQTWSECEDITYITKIDSVEINGNYASVKVYETANGTLFDNVDGAAVAGEIHSKSVGIYFLDKTSGKWLISGEKVISDESSLLYGDARFMNMEFQAPEQVSSGQEYTATLKVDADSNTFIIASIDSDPVTYPSKAPQSKLRAVPQSQILERNLIANTNNLNEYAVTSLAISRVKNINNDNFRIYMSGLACIMKRVNVVPKNNFIKIEDKDNI